MAKRIRLEDLRCSEDFRRLNAGVLGDVAKSATTAEVRRPMAEETYAPKLNKSEAEVLRMLQLRYPDAFVVPQPTRFFRLKGGGTYQPDFLVFPHEEDGWRVLVVEVKGGYRGPGAEQGIERYKRAALEFGAHFHFEMYRKERGKWEVIPWRGV